MPDIMQEPLTVFTQLPPTKPRLKHIVETFEQKYGSKPAYIARAPGRIASRIALRFAGLAKVSIIGEHIDYAGLSVMPAAIDRDVIQACLASPSKDGKSRVHISNVNDKFKPEDFDFQPGKEGPVLDSKHHSWVNYFKAGMKGALGHMSPDDSKTAIELHILVDGNVPPGGGLSSSAAMVVSSAIATLKAFGAVESTTQGQLATIAIDSERLVGVNSGGMDQSASIFSREGALLNIGFVPKLVATLVPIPTTKPAITYVIASSLVTSEKQVTAKYNYNLRVVEMRVVARILCSYLKLNIPMELPTLKHVMDAYFSSSAMHTSSEFLIERKRRLKIMLDIVEDVFGDKKDGCTWDEVYERLGGMNKDSFKQAFHADFEIEAEKLQLYKRAKHAYSEAARVYQYRSLLEQAGDNDPDLALKLGHLMDESQESCRDLFNCSCPEIDEICTIARKSGSLGSRLSGAGWGGCTVHLVLEDRQDELIQALQSEYYAKHYPKLSGEELQEAIFATKPEEGACLYDLAS
ncbi:Galactokinase [Cystobasidium minutum MCA 4210]|uniref:Galactokinase n=1 Tax=Cystobasidium minutum MCA 4210 TaxID=1397322 RepID=UPI0034CE332E|eukprot:jgi/Rhomi1/198601/gm1.6815_g